MSAVFRDELRRRKEGADGGEDLMSALMRTEDERGRLLSDEEVVDNIVSLVLAGYQSTASALMWAVYHLAKTPHALAKLRVSRLLTSFVFSCSLVRAPCELSSKIAVLFFRRRTLRSAETRMGSSSPLTTSQI